MEALLAGVSTKHATALPKHLNRNKARKIHCNLLRNFPLHDFGKHLHRFRYGRKEEHLNLATRQNPAAKPLTTNVLQEFQQQHPRFRSQPVLEHHILQIYPGGASGKGIHQTRTEQHRHLNRNKTRKIHCNLLRNFSLYGFSRHLHWFRYGGK